MNIKNISNTFKRQIIFSLRTKNLFINENHNGFILDSYIIPYQKGIKVHVNKWGGTYIIEKTDLFNNKVLISCNTWKNRDCDTHSWIETSKIRPAGFKAQDFGWFNKVEKYPIELVHLQDNIVGLNEHVV